MKGEPRRWRIRRASPGRWEVHLLLAHPNPRWASYVYVPLDDFPTWPAAGAYVQRTDTSNYGTGVAA